MDTPTGRVVEKRKVAVDPHLRTPLAGWVRRCPVSAVAVYTPDGHRLMVQCRSRTFVISEPAVTATRSTVLTLRSPRQRRMRIYDWAWTDRLIDAMDDRYIDRLASLADPDQVAAGNWNPHGHPV